MRNVIRKIAPHVILVRNNLTGIATVLDHAAGIGHSCHPNIHASGSVRSMRAKGFWGKHDRIVKSDGFKYNIDTCHVSTDYDVVAARACQCGGNHGIHEGKAPGGKKRHSKKSGWAVRWDIISARDGDLRGEERALTAREALRKYRAKGYGTTGLTAVRTSGAGGKKRHAGVGKLASQVSAMLKG